MKIAMDGNWLLGDRTGGIETYVRELVARLPALSPEHDWSLRFVYMKSRHRETIERVADAGWRSATLRLPSSVLDNIAWNTGIGFGRLFGLADVVFLPYSDVPPGTGGRKIVATLHDLIPVTHPEFSTPALSRRFERRVRRSLERCDTIIAVSEHTRSQAIEHFDIEASRIVCVPNGISTSFFDNGDANSTPRGSDDQDLPDRFLLHVGTIEPRKNLARLVRAFDAIALRDPNLHLILVGRPAWGMAELAEAIASARHKNRIVVTGPVPGHTLPSLYRKATAFVFPSLAEGFGIPPLEAMACGCPVVAADATSIPEIVGGAGELFDPTDESAIAEAIERVTRDESRRADMAQRGRTRAAEFSWTCTARATMRILETV